MSQGQSQCELFLAVLFKGPDKNPLLPRLEMSACFCLLSKSMKSRFIGLICKVTAEGRFQMFPEVSGLRCESQILTLLSRSR